MGWACLSFHRCRLYFATVAGAGLHEFFPGEVTLPLRGVGSLPPAHLGHSCLWLTASGGTQRCETGLCCLIGMFQNVFWLLVEVIYLENLTKSSELRWTEGPVPLPLPPSDADLWAALKLVAPTLVPPPLHSACCQPPMRAPQE